jgi:RHS repeat-associated protein
LQEWQDASGNSYTFSYQSDNTQPDYGHVRRIQSSNGSFLGFYYDVFGHIIEAYTGDGRRLKYIYDDHGDLVTVTFPDESQIDYVYQHLTSATNGVTNIYSTHLIIREEKPDGRVLENAYDDLRRVVTQAATVGGDLKLITNATFTYSNNFTNLTNSVITGVTHVDDVFAHRTSYYYTNNLIARTVDALEQEELQVWFSNTNDPGYYPRSLKSKTDQRGLKTDYQYDAFGNLKQVVVTGNLTGGASSNETATSTFAHTSRHLISTNTDPAGNKTVYLYTNSAFPYLPTTVHKLAGATPVATNLFFYTNVAQTVTNGAVFTNRAFGLLQRTIRGGSATNDFVYDGRGLLVQQVGHSGTTDPVVTNTFFYNNRGELVEQTDAANRVRWFAYDGLGRKTAEEVYEAGQTMPVGFTYSYYNENGELVWTDGSRYNPEDYVWRDYDGAGRQITEIRWRSRAKADGTGVEAETGDALYATTFQEFDGFGNLKRTISPLGVVTTNTWDALGRRVNTKVIATNGAVLTSEGIAYEPGGEVAFHTNALEGLTETLYTSTGKPRFRRNADGSTNGWRYYSDGRLHQEFQNNGAYWESTYDDANRQVTRKFYTATGTALATNITELDARGNVIRTVDAAGFAFTNMFDGLDRLKVAMGPKIIFTNPPGLPEIGDPPPPIQQTTTNFYDAAGVVLTTVNAVGDKTIATTDALGRPVSVEIRNTNNALVRVTTTAYSADQHSATVTNGSGSDALVATSYTDNQGNEVLSVAYPHANVREFTRRVFDPAGNLRNTWRYAATNSALTLFSQEGYGYDGLNRVLSQTNRDSAVTSFEYDVMSHVTNRVMPGGLRWRAEYNAAGQMLKFWNQGEAGGITRSNHFTYYAANHVFAGLPQTHTDGRGVTRTPVYDDYLRPLTNSYAGALPEHNLKTVWRYDLRGAVTNLTQSFTNSSIGPAVSVRRTYDPYNLLASESLWVDGVQHSSADLKWDSAGRRDRLYVGNFLYQFGWQADGVLGSVSASPDVTSPTVGGIYTYNSAGLLTNRVANSLAVSVTARDGVGRVLARTSKVYGVTKLDETLAWTGDGLLANHTVTRAGEFTDARNYDYAAWTRRLVTERVNLDANKRWTNLFTYDAGAASGPGVLTKVAEPQTGGAAWEATLDGFDRIERETNNVIRRIAFGRMNAFVPWASVNVTLDGKPLPLNLLNTGETNWPTQWRTVMELRPGTHTLQAAALHSSGQFTNTAASTFTNNAVDTTTLSHFDEGQLKYRVWRNASGQTNRVQTFTWDARSRLIATSELDASNNGYNWSAVYDAFDRRLRTTTVIVTNGTALTAQPKTINQFFDPSVEFLELGVEIGGKKTMKVFGPDLAGRYGGRNGSGGLDGVVNDLGIFQSVVSDARGNVHGRYDSGGTSDLIWNASRPTGYGAVPEYRPPALADNGDLASSSAWLGLWSDISGLYWRGKRYLDPVSGSWLSCDPYGFDAGTSLYAFAHGDPINYDDPDGRLAARSTQTGTQNAVPRYELGIAPETHSEIYKSWSYDDIGVPLNTPTLTGPGGDYTFANVVQVPTGNAFSYVGPEGTGASLPTPWQTTRISGQEIAQQQNLRGAMLMMNALLIADGAGAVLEGAGIRLLSAEALATRTVLPDAYAGIRQASQYLQEIGVSRAQRVQILQSFEAETVNLRAASATEFGLRFFDGVNAQAKGRYLFETFPASRESLALSPQWNQMTSFTQWQIREGAMLIEGRAAAQGVGLPGGQIQKFVPNLDNLLK